MADVDLVSDVHVFAVQNLHAIEPDCCNGRETTEAKYYAFVGLVPGRPREVTPIPPVGVIEVGLLLREIPASGAL
jgi:hypothetical protein